MSNLFYKSTRGSEEKRNFEQVVLDGLAHDNGLYVPNRVPVFTSDQIEDLRSCSFSELAWKISREFISSEEISNEDLKSICDRSISKFQNSEVTPIQKIDNCWVLELFHGPTFAFKDVALQFLGNIFEYFLTRGRYQKSITILGATSGDTGSAAIHGLRGKQNVECFIMFPEGKVTKTQELQMTTVMEDNVHCMSLLGDFDDCQAAVKAAFFDEKFRSEMQLGAVNSINWARILAQITYYFYSYFRVTDALKEKNVGKVDFSEQKLNFAVPTGNFGDILAGYYAKQMGLPIGKLIICTNKNDVLHRFLTTGTYKKLPCVGSLAPSMDISVSSNFERYLYHLCGNNSEQLAAWMHDFETKGEFSVSETLLAQAKVDFLSHSSGDVEILDTISVTYVRSNYVVCPHTATAIAAVNYFQHNQSESHDSIGKSSGNNSNNISNNILPENTVVLATAHPMKFDDAVSSALNKVINNTASSDNMHSGVVNVNNNSNTSNNNVFKKNISEENTPTSNVSSTDSHNSNNSNNSSNSSCDSTSSYNVVDVVDSCFTCEKYTENDNNNIVVCEKFEGFTYNGEEDNDNSNNNSNNNAADRDSNNSSNNTIHGSFTEGNNGPPYKYAEFTYTEDNNTKTNKSNNSNSNNNNSSGGEITGAVAEVASSVADNTNNSNHLTAEAIKSALQRPYELEKVHHLPVRKTIMPSLIHVVKAFVREKVAQNAKKRADGSVHSGGGDDGSNLGSGWGSGGTSVWVSAAVAVVSVAAMVALRYSKK